MLRGHPLIHWSAALLRAAGCTPLVVAAPAGFEDRVGSLFDARDVIVVTGGDTRQASVGNALQMIESATVVVHDGARPLASPALVERVLGALADADGAVPALPMDEAVKRATGSLVTESIDRRDLTRVQTPQAFVTTMLKDAHRGAAADGYLATDDAELVERYGGRVVVVAGEPWNIKVTYPDDFTMAEALMEARSR